MGYICAEIYLQTQHYSTLIFWRNKSPKIITFSNKYKINTDAKQNSVFIRLSNRSAVEYTNLGKHPGGLSSSCSCVETIEQIRGWRVIRKRHNISDNYKITIAHKQINEPNRISAQTTVKDRVVPLTMSRLACFSSAASRPKAAFSSRNMIEGWGTSAKIM